MTVLEAVKHSKVPYFMIKSAIKAAEKLICETENILWAQTVNFSPKPIVGTLPADLRGFSGTHAGVLVVTDQRLLLVSSSFGLQTTKEMRLSSVRSIDARNNLITECMRISGVSDMMVVFCNREHMPALRNAINEAIEKRNAPQAAAPAPQPADNDLSSTDIEQLQALKQLYDTGVLTEEEFTAKKAQILGL